MNEMIPNKPGQEFCPSDMRLALENLERLFHACRFCLNTHASHAVLLGIAVEAQTLALKMEAMYGRWNKYLPFHEVIDVKFDHWLSLVNQWIEVLAGRPDEELQARYPWIEPSKDYMLDLYVLTEQTDESGQPVARAPRFYEVGIKDDYEREMAAYMERTDDLLDEMGKGDFWQAEVSRMATYSLRDAFIRDLVMPLLPEIDTLRIVRMEREVKENFEALVNSKGVHACALIGLRNLQNQLCDLKFFFTKALPNDMFIRLCTRLFYRYCLDSYREGGACVNKWRNIWPEPKLKKNAEKKKDELKKQLLSKPYGSELQDYIVLDEPNLFTNSSFGRFLFKNRHELKVEDLQFIHKVCREQNLLNELIAEEEGTKVRTYSAPIRQLSTLEQDILKKLETLVKKASWEGITEEGAITALQRALGVGFMFAHKGMEEMSDSLWKLLKKRRGCDAEKSLKVTWLNIVGYCVKKKLLSGGSPALAKQFFPRCGSDDYKAIDKGRNAENNKNFQAIIPLLDACFR